MIEPTAIPLLYGTHELEIHWKPGAAALTLESSQSESHEKTS